MNTIMSFSAFLTEKRKNPTLNPKVSILKQLEPYFDDPDVYISMRNEPEIQHSMDIPKPTRTKPTYNKLGINLKNAFNTPTGIYSYNLNTYKEKIISSGGLKGALPFLDKNNYIFVFKPKAGSYIVKLGNITRSWVVNFIEKVLKKDPSFAKKFSDLQDNITELPIEVQAEIIYKLGVSLEQEEGGARVPTPGGVFWWVSFLYSSQKNTSKWNKFFRDFGIDGVDDNLGEGIIHNNEKYQTVFFNAGKLDRLHLGENKNYSPINVRFSTRNKAKELPKGLPEVAKSFTLNYNNTVKNLKNMPKNVLEVITIEYTAIESLEGMALLTTTNKLFITENNNLTSLKGIPIGSYVGKIFINNNANLTSLIGMPKVSESAVIDNSGKLKSLVGCENLQPDRLEIINMYGLETLDGLPKKVNNLDIERTTITSLKGCPEIINGNFVLKYNDMLKSFEHFPKEIHGNASITRNAYIPTEEELHKICKIKGTVKLYG